MAGKYDIPDYDKYLCLKVTPPMWAAILYLIHPYWLLVLSVVNLKDKTGLIDAVYPDRLPMSLAAAAAIPALAVVYAWMKRKPDSGNKIRWIWINGKWFLTVSSILYMAIAATRIELVSAYQAHYLIWAQLGTGILIIVFLFTSTRVKDTFSDFPKSESDTE